MDNFATSIPRLQLQSLAVDFIDNRLPAYHRAFHNPPAIYDPSTHLFSSKRTDMDAPSEPHGRLLSPRPLASSIDSMAFWDDIFPDAMRRLCEQSKEPQKLEESGYGIRCKRGWDDVQSRLEAARDLYTNETGKKGWVRKMRRNAIDKSQPVLQTLKFIPNVDYVSPVINTVQFVLEAAQRAANIRKEMSKGFEQLQVIFEDIELFLATFPTDDNVRNAAVNVVTTVLFAIEQAISYYTKSLLKKMGYIIFRAEEYEGNILEALAAIDISSQALIHQAQNSSIHGIRKAMDQALRDGEEIRRLQYETKGQQRIQTEYLRHVKMKMGETLDGVQRTENDIVEIKEGLNSVKDLLGVLVHTYDLKRESGLEEARQNRERDSRLRLEVERSPTPCPGPFTAVQSPPLVIASEWHVSPAQLYDLLNIHNIDREDLQHIERRRVTILPKHIARAEQIIQTHQFISWLTRPFSSKLLVHGNYSRVQYMSPLSVLCSTLTKALRRKENFAALVFFCGCHVNGEAEYFGGQALIRSLIAQILCQHALDTRYLHHEVNLNFIPQGGLDMLCTLLLSLLRRLPESITVFFFVDGIGYYEREETLDDMLAVLNGILRSLEDGRVKAAVKILITSVAPTSHVRGLFQDEEILNMASVRPVWIVPNSARIERQLGIDSDADERFEVRE